MSAVERAAYLGYLPLYDAKVLGLVLVVDGGPWGKSVHSTDSVLCARSLELPMVLVKDEVVGLRVHFHVGSEVGNGGRGSWFGGGLHS